MNKALELILITSLFWVAIMTSLTTSNFRVKEDAIKHGAAHYDSRTGEFTWNDEVKP